MPSNRPFIYTAFNSAAEFTLGMISSQRGPSFNDLTLIAKTDLEGGSYFASASKFGFMLGSLIAAIIYGKFRRKSLLIASAMTFAAFCIVSVPWCTTLVTMVIIHCGLAFFAGVYETSVSTEELQAWDGKSESAMLFLSFCFSSGGVVAPLITEPFLAPKALASNLSFSTIVNSTVWGDGLNLNLSSSTANISCLELVTNCSNEAFHNMSSVSISPSERESRIHFAYLITAVLCVTISLAFYATYIESYCRKRTHKVKEKKSILIYRKLPKFTYIVIVGLTLIFFFFHTLGTDSFGQFLFFFVVTHLDWSNHNGAYLVSLVWGLGMCLKLMLVAIYKRVSSGIVILISVSALIISMVMFSFAGHFRIDFLIWMSTAIYAMSEASVYGGALAWVDGNLIQLDGRLIGAIMMSGGLGAFTGPLPLGALMKNITLMSFPFMVLATLLTSGGLFYVMVFVLKPMLHKKHGPLRSHSIRVASVEKNEDTEAATEMIKSTTL